MTDSIRKQILLKMQAMYQAASVNGTPFSTVAIGPLGDWDNRKHFSIGIVANQETALWLYPVLDNTFIVHVEFRAAANRDDENPGLLAEDVLTAVKQAIYADRTLGGLAIDCLDNGNEVDLVTYADRRVIGVMTWKIRFRNSSFDPTTMSPAYG